MIYTTRDITINTLNFEVKKGDEIIHLTCKEFKLLEFLLKNKNKVVSLEAIKKNIFNNASADSQIDYTYISFLRDKLGQDVVKTFVNVGYIIK